MFLVAHPLYTIAGSTIYYVRNAAGDSSNELTQYDLESGKRTRLALFTRELKPGLTLSPDRHTLLYWQSDRSGSDLAILEHFR